MPNTTVTITYANGSTREFVASDDLERMINDGHMFSVTTMHSDMGIAEEMLVSKMYVGNPVAAMGNMMMMLRNAEGMRKSKSTRIVKQVLTTCIKLMSDEITSFQSEMSPVMPDIGDGTGERSYYERPVDDDTKHQRAEKLIGELYLNCRDSQNINQHNPYSWAELNEDLMLRIQEFIPAVETVEEFQSKPRQFRKSEPLVPVDMTQMGDGELKTTEPRMGEDFKSTPFGDNKSMNECTATKELCEYYMVNNKKYQEPVHYCNHPDNKGVKGENDCTGLHCPFCTDGGG